MKNCFLNTGFLLATFLLSAWTSLGNGDGDKRISREDYINTWKSVAIQNMNEFKIPASITLAQAILESGDGNSELAKMSNNHFGIKCHDWKGERVYYDDDKKGECFRKYEDAGASFADHSRFLMRKRYASLFELKLTDYKGWAKGLKKCGYATNPAYAKLLIDLIERHELHKYDKEYSEAAEQLLAKTELKPEHKEERAKRKNSSKLPSTITLSSSREVSISENNIKFILAKEGDSVEQIAEDMELPVWLIRKYNDLPKEKGHQLSPGELVYIQPKRSKAKKKVHVYTAGDSMRGISQQYGIKLKALYKKNSIKFGTEPATGTKLVLKGRVQS